MLSLSTPSSQISGHVKITKRKASGIIVGEWEFSNLITDNGLDLWGGEHDIVAYCFVGSGNAAPAFTDTQLQARIATSPQLNDASATTGSVSAGDQYAWMKKIYTFGAGVAAGNISEVGFGKAANNLLSRALILDAQGNPTSITVLSDEILDVEYEHRQYLPMEDGFGTFTLSGNSGGTYEYVSRAASRGVSNRITGGWTAIAPWNGTGTNTAGQSYAYSGGIGAVGGAPSGNIGGTSGRSISAYVPGTYTTNGSISFNRTSGIGSILSVVVTLGRGIYQFEFDRPIVKKDTETLSLTFSSSFGRR